jgi:cell division protease FtsH
MVDAEVHNIIERNYKRAEQILKDNLEKLHIMAEALMKYETIGMDQIHDVMKGLPIREPASWRGKDTPKKPDEVSEGKDSGSVQPDASIKLGDNNNQGTASANGTSTN